MPIRVTIEVIPHGVEAEKQVVATAYIENVGGTDEAGNYGYSLYGRGGMNGHMDKRVAERAWMIASGIVEGFPRRSRGVWGLLQTILAHREESL